MKKIYYRSYQKALKYASYFLNWREPKLLKGSNSFEKLPELLEQKEIKRLLIVTDRGIEKAGLLNNIKKKLVGKNISYSVFDQVESNPSITTIEKIAVEYKKNYGEAIVAVGGGSVLDAAKAAGIIINKPEKDLENYKGLLKVWHEVPNVVAVPTTAGTGSEATLAAVISDPNKKEKYAIMDLHLIPDYAVLDPKLTESLPADLTAETGMDALTHAVEAFIGNSNTKKTHQLAKETVKIIDNNLKQVYHHGDDLKARENMLEAAYYSGLAFTRAYVGNVHAISHALTAFYGLPHGRTNATVLPIVLRIYGKSAKDSLAELADHLDLTPYNKSKQQKASTFIEWIENLNDVLDIPKHIPEIKDNDLEAIAAHADGEANPLYPVPEMFSVNDFIKALKKIKGKEFNEEDK